MHNIQGANLDMMIISTDNLNSSFGFTLFQNAYDMAMKIRQAAKGRDQPVEKRTMAHEKLKNWKGKLDSRGFRILKDQVHEYTSQTNH